MDKLKTFQNPFTPAFSVIHLLIRSTKMHLNARRKQDLCYLFNLLFAIFQLFRLLWLTQTQAFLDFVGLMSFLVSLAKSLSGFSTNIQALTFSSILLSLEPIVFVPLSFKRSAENKKGAKKIYI